MNYWILTVACIVSNLIGIIVTRILMYQKPSGTFYIDETNIEDVKVKLEMTDDIDIIAKQKHIILRIVYR